MRRPFAVLSLAALLLAAPARGQDLKEGLTAYKRGDFAAAIAQWRPLAEAGHPGAQYNLGFSYVQGKGVPKDLVRAYFWFDLAARRGEGIAGQLRDGIARKLTPDQLAQARAEIDAWLARNGRPR